MADEKDTSGPTLEQKRELQRKASTAAALRAAQTGLAAATSTVPAVALVLRPFVYLLRHTPIRPKSGLIEAADEVDAKERIRQRHGFSDLSFEVEITPAQRSQ